MKLIFKNSELVPAINFLNSMELKGVSESRHRSKLVKKLNEALETVQESEMEMLKVYAVKDESGELVKKSEQEYDIVHEKKAEYYREHTKFLNETVTIESGIYANNFEKLYPVLANYEGLISGQYAHIFDRSCT